MNQENSVNDSNHSWPELPIPAEWEKTLDAVHLWSQIIGKIRLEHMPWINHCWHVTLYVSARGLTTSLIPHPSGGFEIEFNFLDHRLDIRKVTGKRIFFDLKPMSVADFYVKTLDGLRQLDIATDIYPKPVELPDPIVPFPENTDQAPYHAEAVHHFWRALTDVHRVFTRFRADFTGKVSPVHFFWGAFDLAVTRFSGRSAPKHPGGVPNCPDWVMEESYSHELSSAGFWPGTGLGEAAFYSYAYPEPEGYRTADIEPGEAWYHEDLGEFILSYESVRTAENPDKTLLKFLQSTYTAAAANGNWDRNALEPKGHPNH
ncbi:DUF5996 family protein [Aliifodinibius sp. S!AR15-10]|uniref:DUF5996 family protein n=1 Tax=Aliifodinibius sp. S!AR15-10 TaxID=2950437 RepID=UPI002857A234|nr:DUF5996 family protein [Aliifodinibius sp. S!AR15-10]MDR8393954.1 DUF5996 family protein [Aliifodinibius sp. S!AR15-10]